MLYQKPSRRLVLFDLKNDPAETKDVSGTSPEIVQSLSSELERRLADGKASAAPKIVPTEQVREMLRAAGYLP